MTVKSSGQTLTSLFRLHQPPNEGERFISVQTSTFLTNRPHQLQARSPASLLERVTGAISLPIPDLCLTFTEISLPLPTFQGKDGDDGEDEGSSETPVNLNLSSAGMTTGCSQKRRAAPANPNDPVDQRGVYFSL